MKDISGWAGAGRMFARSASRGRRTYRAPRPRRPNELLTPLLGTIEGEIIPRLLMAHQYGPGTRFSEGVSSAHPVIDDVREFARIVVEHDLEVACAYVESLIARAVSLDSIYLELFAPTARLLGQKWESDDQTFTDVTIGLCRLRQLIREYSHSFVSEGGPSADRSVLLSPLPGEQHVLGLIMVADFFRRAGWDVSDVGCVSGDELTSLVKGRAFAVVGISLACETRSADLSALIARLRAESRNPAIRVMVGGCPFLRDPDLVRIVGADATANDAREAPVQAEALTRLADIRV